MFTKWTLKECGKTAILFILYIVLAYAAMYPGYFSPVYWMLFPIAAAFLMTGPLTVMMSTKRGIGSTLLFPLLFFIIDKVRENCRYPVMLYSLEETRLLNTIDHIGNITDELTDKSIHKAKPAALIYIRCGHQDFPAD